MGLYRIPARWHGGSMAGAPRTLVVHSAETPLEVGYARAIGHFFQTETAKTSAHEMVDPRDVVVMVADNLVAYHCGNGNPRSLGFEQAGYARLNRADWLSAPGEAQMRLLAGRLAKRCARYGIPARWATADQIRAANLGGPAAGLATHDDMRRALGGTTHTDPMPHYPKDELLDLVRAALAPAPQEDDMTTDQLLDALETPRGQEILRRATWDTHSYGGRTLEKVLVDGAEAVRAGKGA